MTALQNDRLQRISNYTEIQGDCKNFANDFFDLCDEMKSQIAMGWDFKSYDGEAYEYSYTDPDSDPETILGEKPEIDDWDDFILGLYDKLYRLKALIRREELFKSDKQTIIAYKVVLQIQGDLFDLDR